MYQVAIINFNQDFDFQGLFPKMNNPSHIYVFLKDTDLLPAFLLAKKAKFEFHNLLIWEQEEQYILFLRKGKAYQIINCGDKMCLSSTTLENLVSRFIENSNIEGGKVYNDFIFKI